MIKPTLQRMDFIMANIKMGDLDLQERVTSSAGVEVMHCLQHLRHMYVQHALWQSLIPGFYALRI